MSQAEIVKNRIIAVVPVVRPGPPVPQTVTTFAWNAPPVAVVEKVMLNPRLDPRLVTLLAPGSAQARSYRLLQHRVFAKGDPRIIAVTSAEPGEGKTTCAANLALVLSEESLARVLLIEANLVRPGLADLFAFEPSDSFMMKLLSYEDAAPPYAVASVADRGLQVAALSRPVPGKQLDRVLLAEALGGLRSWYDYIVIDAAPVLENADANKVCQCADGVIMMARAGQSRRGSLARALDQLKPATILGTVLIDA